jgi:hypothetical protein
MDMNTSGASLGVNIFKNATKLKEVLLPKNIKSIPESMFMGCVALEEFTIPDTVTTLGNSAFNGCTSLTSVQVLGNLESIGNSAFYECNSLEEVQEKYIENYSDMWVIKPYRHVPRYMIEYAIFNALTDDIVGWNGVRDKKTAEIFGYNENDDQFSYIMPDKVWEVARKLIKWEGEEQ